jgi:hypothetical protein
MSSPEPKAILPRVRLRLAEAFGDRLRGVGLFGCEARGEHAESFRLVRMSGLQLGSFGRARPFPSLLP